MKVNGDCDHTLSVATRRIGRSALVKRPEPKSQQGCHALWKRVSLANRIAETGRATLIMSCVISNMPRSL